MNESKIGLAPGTLVYTGEVKDTVINYDFIHFNEKEVIEEKAIDGDASSFKIKKDYANWLNITGLHDIEAIAKIGTQFKIHNLILEDILNVNQLPKADEIDDHLFVTLKMLSLDQEKKKVIREQISLLLAKDHLITFQEKEGDVFESVRHRIRKQHAKIRSRRNDYLLFALMDAVIDQYFLITSAFNDKVEHLEEEVLAQTKQDVVQSVLALKKELTQLKKFINPIEQVIFEITKEESEFVSDSISPYFSDLIDHIRQVKATLEDQRDVLSSLVDLHISLVSNEMNAIMKTLTIVAAIFIPLTFLAGVYGMNFENMPELSWKYSYPILLSTMFALGVGLWIYMKRKKWL